MSYLKNYELVKNGLSIQAQEKYPLTTACDQRGEQTINRDAKTAGTLLHIDRYNWRIIL